MGHSKNNTQDCHQNLSSYSHSLLSHQIVVPSCLLGVGFLGNFMVIIVILFNKKMKSVTNTYLLNIAISDLMYLMGIPFNLMSLIQQNWSLGLFSCKAYWFITCLNQFSSVFILTALAFDRFLAVCHPNKAKTWRKLFNESTIIVICWLIGFMSMIPIAIYSNIEHTDQCPTQSCTILWPSNRYVPLETLFIGYGVSVAFVIPLWIIAYCYLCIVIHLWKKRVPLTGEQMTRNQIKRFKISTMVLSVMSLHIISYTPYWIFQLWLMLRSMSVSNSTISCLSQLFQCLMYLNSSVNPYLYAFLSDAFQQSLKQLFLKSNEHKHT